METPVKPRTQIGAPDRGEDFLLQPPSIELPKGGGAIRGIGEKVTVGASGTSSLSIPLPASPGRAGFGPSIALQYDSGRGNGPFGLGWQLATPSVARWTDRGLPRYQDEDVF